MNSAESKHLYTRDYFLGQVDGFREFAGFRGEARQLFERHRRNLELLELGTHHRFLDIGCGRGELVLWHARRGGAATGIDYAPDAVALGQEKARELRVSCRFVLGSFSDLARGECYDRLLASEFIEHISAREAEAFFALARELVAPGGRLLVYTYPNVLQRRIGYRLQRWLVRLTTGERLPLRQLDEQSEHYRQYHLNEQSFFSLRASARRAGFRRVQVWYDVALPSPRTCWGTAFRFVAHRGPLRHLFLNHLVCCAEP